ncbi:MAG: hypothetical protein E5X58_26635 [Mesorhizobium sp.]|nr:MAG: hypothetical protein E5X58_26635 [Mesorhizobium sp.]
MVLQCAFDRCKRSFPFGAGKQSTGASAEQPAQDSTGANCHCAFRQRPRLLRRLEREFGNTRTKSAGSSGSQAALDDRGADRCFADKGAARNERRNIQAGGKNRTKGAVPTGGVDRPPVFIFHVDLRFHRLEGRAVENRHEPIGAALVFRPLDLTPNFIASEAVARGNIDAGKLVVPP